MVDTYSKGADSRKLYKKNHGDGEDPIIIAQRFLNIFRQLHIFSTERKEAFNKMILEQPPEIRGMFGSLPGGSVLQEYVDELEQSAGVARDHSGEFQTASATPELNDEISRAKFWQLHSPKRKFRQTPSCKTAFLRHRHSRNRQQLHRNLRHPLMPDRKNRCRRIFCQRDCRSIFSGTEIQRRTKPDRKQTTGGRRNCLAGENGQNLC